MAGLLCHGTSGEVALVASTAKSLCQVKAPTNQRLLIRSIRMFGKAAAGGTDTPVKVRLTYSSANFGTFSGGVYAKADPTTDETAQATFGGSASVEPTTPTDLGLYWELQPQSGIEEFLPLAAPIVIPGGKSVQFECTSTGTPTIVVTVGVEE